MKLLDKRVNKYMATDSYENYIKKLLPQRPENSHKGTFGHVLNVAGSGFYTGAAYFSSISALKVGCGRVTLASSETCCRAVSALSPDIILKPLKETKEKTIHPQSVREIEKKLDKSSVVSVGCGLSMNSETMKFLKELIKILNKYTIPVIFDADGLSIIGKLMISKLPQNTILTPHPKELSDLMGVRVDDILKQPEFWIKECCEKYNCTTVLKLHKTIVADSKGNFYVNNTGNSALSHGGSGDILCGMISGFLSQGLSCFEASVLSVYLHGRAAEIASEELTEYSTLSSDLLNYIPKAIKMLI